MSLNIGKSLLQVASTYLEIRISDLTPRQQRNLRKMVARGVVVGNGLPAKIACMILDARNEPYFHLIGRGLRIVHPDRITGRLKELTSVLETETAKFMIQRPDDATAPWAIHTRSRVFNLLAIPTDTDIWVHFLTFGDDSYRVVPQWVKEQVLEVENPSVPDVIKVKHERGRWRMI